MMQEEEIIYEASGVIEEVSPEVVEVEIFEAFQAPTTGDKGNHALLTNTEIPNAHPITAITGLRERLDSIEALQTVYSDKKGNADYYEWADGHALGENGVGYFVSLNQDARTISICTGDDIFGVVVDNAAFVGGQDDIARDAHYGLVATSGAVHVRCELDVAEGDYVVSNAYGIATTASSGRGYKVVALHDIKGVPHATINLTISADQIDLMGAELQSLGVRMGSAETDIVSAINVANEAHKRSLEAATSSYVSEEAVKNALESILNSKQEIEDFKDIIGSTSATAAQAKAIAESAVVSAASMREEAVKNVNETWAKIDELTDDIVVVDDKTDQAMSAIIRTGRELQSLMTVIDKYSVGEYSQANGLTLEQATEILEEGMMYVPTSHENLKAGTKYHTETYANDNNAPTSPRTFVPGYLYQWAKLGDYYGWLTVDKNNNPIKNAELTEEGEINTAGCAIYFASQMVPSVAENSQYGYWYTDGDTSTGSASEYAPYTLYKWEQPEGEEGYWFAVATLAGNVSNRATSQVRQTANEIAAEITNARGSFAGLDARLTDTESKIISTTQWVNGKNESGNALYNMTAIEQKSDENGSSLSLVVADKEGNKILNGANIVLAQDDDNGSYVSIDADRINFGGNGTEEMKFAAKNIDFTGDDFTVSASNIDFTGHTINIDASDVLGIQSPHFSVDTAGNMVAKSGRLADWEISENTLKSGKVGLSSVAVTADNLNPIRIYAGDDTADNAAFKVYDNGSMHSTRGYVADWEITKGKISSGDTLLISDNSIEYPSLIDGDSYVRFSAGGTRDFSKQEISLTKTAYSKALKKGNDFIIQIVCEGSITDVTVSQVNFYKVTGEKYTDIDASLWTATVDKFNKMIKIAPPTTMSTDYNSVYATYTYTFTKTVTEARSCPAFKVLADGSLYASAVDISGTIHATQGGHIGPFALTSSGLDSGYIKLDEKKAYFPVQTELNLNDSVKLFSDMSTNTSYITTTNSQDFVIQNFSGAGIKFNKDSEFTSQEISLSVSGPDKCNNTAPTGGYTDGITWINEQPYIDIIATLSAALPFPHDEEVVVRYACIDGLSGKSYIEKRFTVRFEAFNASTSCQVALVKGTAGGTNGTKYNPLNDNGTGIFFANDTFATTNSISRVIHSYSGTNNVLYSLGNFNPINDRTQSLGSNGQAWGNMYLYTGTQVGSDIRLKNTIEVLPKNYEVFFDGLKPVSYILNEGQSGRKHIGFIAQDVEQSLSSANIDTKDFAGLCIPREGELYYMLRYEEFIALNTHMIQKLKARTTELENKVVELTELVKRLEEKLNTQQND